MKRTRLRKKSRSKEAVIQDNIWTLCKKITRLRFGNVCYTCGKTGLIGSDWQTGHMWPKGSLGAYMKYDLRILRPQCFHCNINLGGMGAVFYSKMSKEIGSEEMSKLERDKLVVLDGIDGRPKAYEFYQKILPEYQAIYDSLSGKPFLIKLA